MPAAGLAAFSQRSTRAQKFVQAGRQIDLDRAVVKDEVDQWSDSQ
jgi:hypothetical protein